MRPFSIFPFALALGPARSWIIPRDLEDGIYHINIPEDYDHTNPELGANVTMHRLRRRHDKVYIERVDSDGDGVADEPQVYPDPSHPEYDPDIELPPFQNQSWQYWDDGKLFYENPNQDPTALFDCSFNKPMFDKDEWKYASQHLSDYCDYFGVRSDTAHISLSKNNEVVAYVCNYAPNVKPCTAKVWEEINADLLNVQCGPLRPGWAYDMDFDVSYGRAWHGSDICFRPRRLWKAYMPFLKSEGPEKVKKYYWKGMPDEEWLKHEYSKWFNKEFGLPDDAIDDEPQD